MFLPYLFIFCREKGRSGIQRLDKEIRKAHCYNLNRELGSFSIPVEFNLENLGSHVIVFGVDYEAGPLSYIYHI